VVEHLVYVLAFHESNAIIVYSSALASQIPRSYAANAFNVFQEAMHRFEILRLCALWDPPRKDRESIPTIVELIDDAAVIDALVEETRASWTSGMPPIDPSEDPALDAAVRASIAHLNETRTQEKTAEARNVLRTSIEQSREIERSTLLASVRDLRNRHLAHSLSQTAQETAQPMKYGDERKLLLDSIPLVQALHLWVNCTSFNFDDSRKIAQRNAEALWKRCTFEIER
jgi:HEPN superfamily AbiU2-like protein